MDTRQCVGIVLRRIRGGVKEVISREKDGHKAMCRNSTEENKRRCEVKEVISREKDGHKAMCRNSTEENKRRCER